MIADKIQQYLDGQGKEIEEAILEDVSFLAANSFSRQFGIKQEASNKLRLSSIGRCIRQQAYNYLGFEKNGKEIDARAKMVFFQGDLAEIAVIELMKVAGLSILNTGVNQLVIKYEGVEGHPDGIFINDFNKKFLLEVKSMSSFSFAEFQRGEIDEGYIFQINAYLEALSLEECVMVVLNKDAGVLHEHLIIKNPEIVSKIKSNIKSVLDATREDLPKRAYSPNDKGIYPWQCNYCAYRTTCLPDAELVLIKNKYQLKAKNES